MSVDEEARWAQRRQALRGRMAIARELLKMDDGSVQEIEAWIDCACAVLQGRSAYLLLVKAYRLRYPDPPPRQTELPFDSSPPTDPDAPR